MKAAGVCSPPAIPSGLQCNYMCVGAQVSDGQHHVAFYFLFIYFSAVLFCYCRLHLERSWTVDCCTCQTWAGLYSGW